MKATHFQPGYHQTGRQRDRQQIIFTCRRLNKSLPIILWWIFGRGVCHKESRESSNDNSSCATAGHRTWPRFGTDARMQAFRESRPDLRRANTWVAQEIKGPLYQQGKTPPFWNVRSMLLYTITVKIQSKYLFKGSELFFPAFILPVRTSCPVIQIRNKRAFSQVVLLPAETTQRFSYPDVKWWSKN